MIDQSLNPLFDRGLGLGLVKVRVRVRKHGGSLALTANLAKCISGLIYKCANGTSGHEIN